VVAVVAVVDGVDVVVVTLWVPEGVVRETVRAVVVVVVVDEDAVVVTVIGAVFVTVAGAAVVAVADVVLCVDVVDAPPKNVVGCPLPVMELPAMRSGTV
jgi:hypothetical protein